MIGNKQIPPGEALDRLFQIVREEAAENPRFERRLIEAIGYTVIYRGDDAKIAVDPVLVADKGPIEFRSTFASMTVADIKRIGRDANLLVAGDRVAPNTSAAWTDLLWKRAREKIESLVPRERPHSVHLEAAE
jgi:hypothetical protein